MDLNEARKLLEICLSEDLRKEYFGILRRWFSFKSPLTKEEFDSEVRKLLHTQEQIRAHNNFILALLCRVKTTKSTSDKGVFECADYCDYVQPSSPTMYSLTKFENRSAAAELFIPDSTFIAARISVTLSDNGLNGAEHNVSELVLHACQVFVKNIIVAMISRKKGYKIRDQKFQYGFNLPIPDPFIRNYNNLIDEAQESKVDIVDKEDTFMPKPKPSLENAEQQAAFAYSCAKRQKCDNQLNVKLLYETLRENPNILGFHEMQSVNLLKLSLQIDD